MSHDRAAAAIVDDAGGVSFSNVPGIAFEYANLGFALLGQIVQVVSGMSFQEVFQFAYARSFIPTMKTLAERVGMEVIVGGYTARWQLALGVVLLLVVLFARGGIVGALAGKPRHD